MQNSREPSVDNYTDKLIEDTNNIEKRLRQYEKECLGIPGMPNKEMPKYINMSIGQLRKLTPLELVEGKLELQKYSLYIQRLINKESAWKRWAESKLDELAAYFLPNVAGSYGWQGNLLIAKNTHPSCKALNNFIRDVNLKIDRMRYLPSEINKIADTMNDLRFVATQKENISG